MRESYTYVLAGRVATFSEHTSTNTVHVTGNYAAARLSMMTLIVWRSGTTILAGVSSKPSSGILEVMPHMNMPAP